MQWQETTNTTSTMATIASTHETGKWHAGELDCFCTWTTLTKYTDGSTYTGYLDRYGKRTGAGTFRVAIYSTLSSAAYPIATWMEYKGEWLNDKPHGMGVARRYRGGTESFCVSTLIYNGVWANGEPVEDP